MPVKSFKNYRSILKIIFYINGILLINYGFYTVYKLNELKTTYDCGVYGCIDDYLDFQEFDNENGVNKYIIPNIAHYIYINQTKIKFYQMICIFSLYFNHKPDLIYFHCNNCSFHGKYWNKIKSVQGLWSIIKIHRIPFYDSIFSAKNDYIDDLGRHWIHYHKSDVLRLLVLMNYGGFYFDNDVYVIQSLNKYRKYEITIELSNNDNGTASQVIVAHKNARLLKAVFDTYRFEIY